MAEQKLTLSRMINAPVEHVWDVLTDLPRLADRLSGVESVHIMSSGPYAVGTRWRQTRTFFGRSATEEMWVRHNDPWRGTVIEAGNDTAYRIVWSMEPLGDVDDEGRAPQTQVRVSFSGTSTHEGALARAAVTALAPLGLAATRTAMEQDLDDIAAAARSLVVARCR